MKINRDRNHIPLVFFSAGVVGNSPSSTSGAALEEGFESSRRRFRALSSSAVSLWWRLLLVDFESLLMLLMSSWWRLLIVPS